LRLGTEGEIFNVPTLITDQQLPQGLSGGITERTAIKVSLPNQHGIIGIIAVNAVAIEIKAIINLSLREKI
jgi:hypothetical protein